MLQSIVKHKRGTGGAAGVNQSLTVKVASFAGRWVSQWVGVPMCESTRLKVAHVIGPRGPLTAADLPSPDIKRWSVRRKAEVVAAVRGGLLSFDEACSRYALNSEEFLSWQYCIDHYGLPGLRTIHTQFYLTPVAQARSLHRRRPR